MHTTQQLKQDLAALGVCPGDAVLMHSSYKSLGGIEGGAAGFFAAFLELLGAQGTLALPALSYAYFKKLHKPASKARLLRRPEAQPQS